MARSISARDDGGDYEIGRACPASTIRFSQSRRGARERQVIATRDVPTRT